MKHKTIVNEITRASIDLEIMKGQPPEDALRMALEQLLHSLARAVKSYDEIEDGFFPMIFPMQMTLKSEQLNWNFRLVFRIENAIGD